MLEFSSWKSRADVGTRNVRPLKEGCVPNCFVGLAQKKIWGEGRGFPVPISSYFLLFHLFDIQGVIKRGR
jgi:hypothetical protein